MASEARGALVLAVLAAGFGLVFLAACLGRFDGAVPTTVWASALAFLPAVVGLKLLAVLANRSHRGWWRLASLADFASLAESASAGSLAAFATAQALGHPLPRSIFLLDWVATVLGLVASRAAVRAVRDVIVTRPSAASPSPITPRLPIPQEIDPARLLNREPVRLDRPAIGEFLRGKVVLVTGASGSIGSEICRQALGFSPAKLVLVDVNENGLFYLERELADCAGECELVPNLISIQDFRGLRTLFEAHRPEVVLHAAAHKHVPMMERNPGAAVKNNVLGTRTLAAESLRAGVEAFVMISTDKAVNPSSVMGASKRLAEMTVQSLDGLTRTRMVTVRFGNVLGSTGSVVPIFSEQIRRGARSR